MKRQRLNFALVTVLVCLHTEIAAAIEHRHMAVTIDDLPIAGAIRKDATTLYSRAARSVMP